MRLYCGRMGPKSMIDVLVRGRKFGHRQADRKDDVETDRNKTAIQQWR